MQTITISLPEQLYWQVKQRSPQNLRDVANQLLSVVSEALPAQEETAEFEDELAQLPFLADEALWQAAQIKSKPRQPKMSGCKPPSAEPQFWPCA